MANTRKVALGDLSFLVEQGKVRCICHRDTEIVRAIDCPVRDPDWGTIAETDIVETFEDNGWRKTFNVGGVMDGELQVSIDGNTLTAALRLTAKDDIETSRAGFTVLHPIDGVAGTAMVVTHPDGTRSDSEFPLMVSPSQPVFDIAGLDHQIGTSRVTIEFSGDVFEMEDQRNWTDASFKTYCRPLSRPTPYIIPKGESVEQGISITVTGVDGRSAPASPHRPRKTGKVPEMLLAFETGWADSAGMTRALMDKIENPVLVLRLETSDPLNIRSVVDIAEDRNVDLECVVPDDADPQQWLGDIASELKARAISPRHVMALPRAYMKSYQPDGHWPTGRTPEQCRIAAKAAFPGSRIGVGMLTNFTELNRCRPPVDQGDYVTHSMTAIVHAADDRSVLETLEAMPFLFATAADFTDDKPCRLGLVSIAMRTNPYAKSVLPNPERKCMPMVGDDPRHPALFGAAFAAAALIEASLGGVEAMALASVGGPFALGNEEVAFPIYHVIKAAAPWRGQPAERMEGLPPGMRGMLVGQDSGMIVNTSLVQQEVPIPFAGGWIVLDSTIDLPGKDLTDEDRLNLEPFAIAFCVGGKSP